MKKLVSAALTPTIATKSLPLENKIKKDINSADSDLDSDIKEWVRCDYLVLILHDRSVLQTGQELSDKLTFCCNHNSDANLACSQPCCSLAPKD